MCLHTPAASFQEKHSVPIRRSDALQRQSGCECEEKNSCPTRNQILAVKPIATLLSYLGLFYKMAANFPGW